MFGWEFPPHITGGLGTACYGLTKALLGKGVEIIFVVPKAYGDEHSESARIINASDIPVDIFDKNFSEYWKMVTMIEIGSNLIPYADPEYFKYLSALYSNSSEVSESKILTKYYTFSGRYGKDLMEEVARYALVASSIARNNDFNVIHSHDWLTYPAGIAAKQISGKPLIVHVHATEFDRSGENINQNVYDIERKGMYAADKVITVSNRTRDIVINRYNIDPAKVVTVHNAVKYPDYIEKLRNNKSFEDKIVSFVGRVTFQKGPDYYVEAAHKVLLKDPRARFVMAGEGDMLYRMIRRVAQLKIADRFHFTGFLNSKEVDRLFALSDVYVMPSVSEPFGISPLEAMYSDVPVIISKQSGVSEILNYALKVDFWDIDAIADAIYGLLHYNALSEFFKKYGRAEVENMKWDKVGSKVNEIYHRVAEIQ
ncbi:MAG: glycosyltransferase family 4 protein [Bacteroidales bacterium]|nr:glycosyltransferase family 4 protein [Bacteroidales bacterium]